MKPIERLFQERSIHIFSFFVAVAVDKILTSNTYQGCALLMSRESNLTRL